MTTRLEVAKTYKLFIGGAFPRSESGRSLPITGADGSVIAHISHASRKDLRDAVEAARKAQAGWAAATAYNRGQVLYRMAEMLEGKKAELVEAGTQARRHAGTQRKKVEKKAAGRVAREATVSPLKEVEAAIDRLVCFGGWADKYAQVLGCNNPVSGPFYNFTVPEPSGVVGVVAPDSPALLGLVSLIAPAICAGNTVVALGSESAPLPAAIFGEVCATSDVPAGVINILTGKRDELVPHFSSHREIDAIHAAGVSAEQAKALREGAAGNVKRVTVLGGPVETGPGRTRKGVTANANRVDWFDDDQLHSPWMIEPMVEMKTIWHPSGA